MIALENLVPRGHQAFLAAVRENVREIAAAEPEDAGADALVHGHHKRAANRAETDAEQPNFLAVDVRLRLQPINRAADVIAALAQQRIDVL